MAHYNDLPREQKLFSNRLYSAVVKAQSPDDPTGHIPNCGIDVDKHIICGCAAMGARIMQAIVDEVAAEMKALDPEYQQFLKLKQKFPEG